MYPATSSIHVPWFKQGLDAHSLTLVWQLGPGEGAAVRAAAPRGLRPGPTPGPLCSRSCHSPLKPSRQVHT